MDINLENNTETKTSILLEIDYREFDIIELLKQVKDINYKVCNLIIGDFIIKNEKDEILFVIERKSIKDLCASILDGRMSEQRSRLIESVQDPTKIVYIIEGKKSEAFIHGSSPSVTKKSINSSILNLIFKHSYRVIFTESKQDTVDNLILLYTKIKESKLKLNETTNSVIKIIKKSDKINDNIFINMLSVIPGVSAKIAIKIHEKYDTFNSLLLAYNNLPNENDNIMKKKMLSDILVSTNRKVGKATSEKIYSSLFKKSDHNTDHISGQGDEKVDEKIEKPKRKTRTKKEGENQECLI
jgi:DNA excision repair protein ERCC-4